MQSKSDAQLLREYAQNGVEPAFAELVARYTNLVYSAAARQVESPDLAAEVAQGVFIGLARGARALSPRLAADTSLAGWLCRSARNISLNLRRDEFRQHSRERQAMEQLQPNSETPPDWERLRPVLDEAMSELSESDYDALVMRFFNNQDLRAIGLALGVSDDTAQKRVSRALEKLREHLSRRGISATAAALSIALSANAVQAAPVGLALAISAATALAGTPIAAAATASTVIKTIAMTTFQKAIIGTTIAAAVGAGVYEARQAITLRSQVQTLQSERAPLIEQLTRLTATAEKLSNEVARAEDSQAMSKAQFNELLKLRGQSGVAQANSREIEKLRSSLAQKPGPMADYLTNAVAAGLKTAEKFKIKDAKAQLARMQTALNLTEDQARAIDGIQQKHIEDNSRVLSDLITGKITPEQQRAMIAEQNNPVEEIKALLTPEQLAAYPEFKHQEKVLAAENSAKGEASRIAEDFNLTPEQQEQIRMSYSQLKLKESANGADEEAAITTAKNTGDIIEAANRTLEQQKSQLEDKLQILGTILTPEQLNTYRQEQMNQMTMQADAVKSLLRPNKAGATN